MFKELTIIFTFIVIKSTAAGLLSTIPATYNRAIYAAAPYTTAAYATLPVTKFAATYAVPSKTFAQPYTLSAFAARAPTTYLKYNTFPTHFTSYNANAVAPSVRYVMTPLAFNYATTYAYPVPSSYAHYATSLRPFAFDRAAFATSISTPSLAAW